VAEFFFDHSVAHHVSHHADVIETPALWVPDATVLSYVQRNSCPFCEKSLKTFTWWSDSAAQLYDDMENASLVCSRCGFWTYTSFLEAGGETNSEIYTSRLTEFDIGHLKAPMDAVLAWLRVHPDDSTRVNPRGLERIVHHILREQMSCELSLTRGTRDGGLDLMGFDTERGKFIVEVKRYASHRKICVSLVRQIAGVLVRENVRWGIIVSTSGPTRDAKIEAAKFRGVDQEYPVNIEFLAVADLMSWLDIHDSRERHTSPEDYWEKQIRGVLKSAFFGSKEFREWQQRHGPG